MTDPTNGLGRPIDKVRAGMRVVDAEGAPVGTVSHVTGGDKPANAGGLPDRNGGWVAGVFDEDGPQVVDGQADRLMSGGYLKVMGLGVNGTDHYVAADEISEVDDLTVVLNVGRDQLMVEQ